MKWLYGIGLTWLLALPVWGLPRVRVTSDDVVIRVSCEVEIPVGTVIADANGNGVIQVDADGVTVRFVSGSVLRGAGSGVAWDALKGIGIRVIGRKDVRIEGARVHGFFNGLVASHADGLEVIGGDFSDNYRQRLRSTPEAEDGADWLFPHHNDERKWRDEFGGAVCVESSRKVLIKGVRVRRGQNGILLDRVTDSRVYDNDASFLSGWGLAMWRSSRNIFTRNAFDFCVRGHVEGVYNRGQDSAGILCFEQSNENVFAENSVTHGGDGFFGFAGREALGDLWLEAQRNWLRGQAGGRETTEPVSVPESVQADLSARGCNRNILAGNDFSYAPAHGIEMTFSEDNIIARNRIVGNAICGIWGGYSSGTWIQGNEISENGGMAYGLERGGVNMEHAADNRILGNEFVNNRCGIHLWWDNDAALLRSPGVAGNYRGVRGNVIAGNWFEISASHPFRNLRRDESLIGIQMRDDGTTNVVGNHAAHNTMILGITNAVASSLPAGVELIEAQGTPRFAVPRFKVLGETRPVGARKALRGRDKILIDEWGPWDHEAPWVRRTKVGNGQVNFELRGMPAEPLAKVLDGDVTVRVAAGTEPGSVWRLDVTAPSGVTEYAVGLKAGNWEGRVSGTMVSTRWDCVFFPWTKETDPRERVDDWRRLAEGAGGVRVSAAALDFPYGWGGPKDLALSDELRARGPGGDRFGMLARTRLNLPAGEWRFKVLSDDGIRIRVNGAVVLENWTWHGPTEDLGRFRQEAPGDVTIEVEHFEIDGYSVLRLEIARETSVGPKV